uniref:Fatty acid desaturase domain-containing protein n=1 Tax=Megaselia scalaris TaxID=36166 RepID=T1GV97_MEGSC
MALRAINSTNIATQSSKTTKESTTESKRPWYEIFETDIVWRNVIIFIILHGLGAHAAYYLILNNRPDIYFVGKYGVFVKKYQYILRLVYFEGHFLGYLGGFGITGGAHRLWCHRAYKAKFPLRVFLMLIQTFAFQNCIYEWCRDHRVHHKFTDTNADPHNSRRGFFFSHMGWLLVRKHKDVKEKGKLVDMSDLEKDPVVMWQKRYYLILMPIISFVVPTILGILTHYMVINSAGHFWGSHPFDKYFSGADNMLIACMTQGEGWHNYHHVFPWDYKAAELGTYGSNYTTAFIDFFAKYGMAYDLKMVTEEMIMKRVRRTGDGSHPKHSSKNLQEVFMKSLKSHNEKENDDNNMLWGWEDKDMLEEDKRMACITTQKSM